MNSIMVKCPIGHLWHQLQHLKLATIFKLFYNSIRRRKCRRESEFAQYPDLCPTILAGSCLGCKVQAIFAEVGMLSPSNPERQMQN